MKIPDTPPDTNDLLETLKNDSPEILLSLMNLTSPLDNSGKYRHWDKLKYLELPENMPNHKIWWILMKIARRNMSKTLPMKGIKGLPFKYCIIDKFQQTLHYLDQFASGNIALDQPIINNQMKNTYLISSLMEESITSSQLEGATTTREVAKKMILEGRNPKSKSERMILNNYNAIHFIRSVKNEKMTPELICEIHKIISENTLDKADKVGEFRNESDNIHIMDDRDEIVFTPPNYTEIEDRVNELCEFCNQSLDEPFFIHPVIRAIIIHFYLAYIHPFVDGNGRTARALFYWSMLKHGYWLTEFISISKIIKKAPVKYGTSYLYVETDENDISYFIDYQLDVIKRAIDELNLYIKKKSNDIENVEKLLKRTKLAAKLNLRQLTLLRNAIKTPGNIYSIHEHKNTHNIAYETARKDLIKLSDDFDLLIKVKEGNTFIFIVPSDIVERIKSST